VLAKGFLEQPDRLQVRIPLSPQAGELPILMENQAQRTHQYHAQGQLEVGSKT
jgi:hypothetical protein